MYRESTTQDCCLTIPTVSIRHLSEMQLLKVGHMLQDAFRALTESEKLSTLILAKKIKGVPHTYLTALRFRHFSPEEHAAGRVLNSH